MGYVWIGCSLIDFLHHPQSYVSVRCKSVKYNKLIIFIEFYSNSFSLCLQSYSISFFDCNIFNILAYPCDSAKFLTLLYFSIIIIASLYSVSNLLFLVQIAFFVFADIFKKIKLIQENKKVVYSNFSHQSICNNFIFQSVIHRLFPLNGALPTHHQFLLLLTYSFLSTLPKEARQYHCYYE
jgi:hypothetical protein